MGKASRGPSAKTFLFVGGFAISAIVQVGINFLPQYTALLEIVNLGALASAAVGGAFILGAWL